ncbi:YihY/virulence factor BrkB family protein [Massilia sp. TS11]|uniref:YihY/virulence factor BrkB family protein n=1 Tax=Massilia sp. TS11 TaxID=2908003 RepID=UPI001EDB82E8|nr:YihY/virulence factor BrkB family protein [Massilia sp. TS11]MCG2584443.1 YihY/virulence factor BrkB family protein [Massilia sp. TS11]
MRPWLRRLRRAPLVDVLVCAVREWLAHRAASKGAALAYYTLFSMAPVLVLVIAIAGLFYGKQAAQGELLHQLTTLLGPQAAQTIQLVLAGARDEASGRLATLIASGLLIFGATTVFAELKDSLDEIWELPRAADSGLLAAILTRLQAFSIVLALGFLLLVSLVISAGLAVLERVLTGVWQEAAVLLGWVASGSSFLVIAALFAVIYKTLPRAHLSWRDVTIGAFGTAALFVLGKFAIGLYVGNSGVANSFGAAGSLIALLLWVYYSAQIFFLGAEFTRQFALRMGSLRTPNRPPAGPAPPPT